MKRLLVIEDEKALNSALVEKLSKDFEVESALNGEDGLSKALSDHPDGILLDILMPKLDGLNMLKSLRADDWGKDAVVIILSNYSDEAMHQKAHELGVTEYLIKSDLSLEDIHQKIKSHF